ncbi:MAG TPA: hypothetical protein VLV46_08070 [Gaiellaceae bacterium]|nr:hypothetical protein [Gaiellaceae bacterium]
MDASAISSRLIGTLLVEKGLITEAQLELALDEQQTTGARLGEILMSQFGVTRADLESALTAQRAENQSLGAPEDSEANAAVRELARMLDEWGRVDQAPPSASPEPPKRPIGEIFVEKGFISSSQLVDALEEQKLSGRKLGEILVSQGKLSRLRLWDALEDQAASFEEPKQETPGLTRPSLRVVSDALTGHVPEHEAREPVEPVEMWEPPKPPAVGARSEPPADESVNGLRAELDSLAARVDALPTPTDEWRDAVSQLGGRLDALADGSGESRTELERLAAQLEEEREAERRLDAQVNELAQRLDSFAGELSVRLDQVSETVTTAAGRDQTDALRHDLDELRAALDALPAPGGDVDELSGRLTTLDHNVSARLQHVSDQLATAATRDQADRLRRELDDLRAALDALPAPTDEVNSLARRVDHLSESFSTRLQQLSDTIGALPAPGGDIDELTGRLTTLDHNVSARLQHVTEQLAAAATREQAERLRRELDDLRAALDALPAPTDEVNSLARRVDHLSESFSTRLQQLGDTIDHAASRDQTDALRHELDGLRTALESLPQPTDEWRDAVGSVSARLDELAFGAAEVRGALDHAHGRIDAGDDNGRRLDERLDAVANAADDLAARVDQLSHSLVDATTREQTDALRGELGELRHRLDSIPAPSDEWREAIAALAVQIDTAQSSEEWRDAVAALAVRLDEVAAPTEELRAEIGALSDRLRGRVERLERDLAATASSETLESVSHHVDEVGHGLEHQTHRLDQIARRLDELAPLHRVDELANSTTETASAHGAALDAIREELSSHARKVQELVEKRRADKTAFRERLDAVEAAVSEGPDLAAALEPLQAHVAELDHRLSELASQQAAERRAELDGLREELLRAAADGSSAHGEVLDTLRHELTAAVAEWRRDVDSLRAELHESAAGATHANGEALDALREELTAQSHRVHETAAAHREAAETLGRRLDELGASVGELDLESLRNEVAAQARRADDALAARREETEALGRRLDELGASVDELDLESLRNELAAQARRADDAATARRAEVEALTGRVDDLRLSVEEHAAGHDAERRAELESLRDDVYRRIEQVAATRAGRAELDALRTQLEQEISDLLERQGQDGAAAEATGQAIRDGLAELARRLTSSEQAYFESGRTLRRSIENLGLAITDADWHLRTGAADEPGEEATSYVAFVPAGDAYRLVECEGAPPYLGQIVEIEGFEDAMLRVSRLGRSPLPFDGRPCAYLERLSPATA